MSPTVPIAMFGWPVVVLVLFMVLPPRRAVIVSMLGAWLLLPMAAYSLPGLPDITKMSVTCLSVFTATVIFDPSKFLRVKWNWSDVAMVAWILVPMASAVNAGYGVYEGLSEVLDQFVSWAIPYLIGRLYFSDLAGLRELAIGIFIGGLIYVPLVLFEARMSPQLHTWLYGYHQHSFAQAKRGNGWRPTVFMQHGLAVAMFMGTAAVCGAWMWRVGNLRAICGMPVWLLSQGLFLVAIACRSSYALLLMFVGIAALCISRWTSTRVILVLMLIVAPLYIAERTLGGWDAQLLRNLAELMGQDRHESLSVRLESEEALWRWVQSQLLLGHGRLNEIMTADQDVWGRFVPDGLWLIALGNNGMVGLVALLGVLLLPASVFLWRNGPRELMTAEMAGATVLMLVLLLYALDNLLNAMINPIYLLVAGGLPNVRLYSYAQLVSTRIGETTECRIDNGNYGRIGAAFSQENARIP